MVDSIYSSIGTFCPLPELVKIGKDQGCLIVVDESHSLGLFGEEGKGLVNQHDLADQVDFITASLAKAFAGRAGIAFMPKSVAQSFPFLANQAIFSSCLLPQDIAALDMTLDIIRHEADDSRKNLQKNATILRQGLGNFGYSIKSQSHIVSLIAGSEANTEVLRDLLEENDIFGSVFCWPATPKNGSLVRLSLNTSIGQKEIERILSVCEQIHSEVGFPL